VAPSSSPGPQLRARVFCYTISRSLWYMGATFHNHTSFAGLKTRAHTVVRPYQIIDSFPIL